MEYFESLSPLLRTFWFIAIPASIIFLIQLILTFTGGDATDGVEADFDGDLQGGDAPFQLFSFRNLVNFLLGFSWTGISFYDSVSSPLFLVVLAVAVGVLFVALFFFVIRQVSRLAEDNTFKIADTINRTGEVYLSIPANRQGKGKVIISVGGSVHELDAMTESGRIETSSAVKVIAVENNILFVEKI
jgi:membrane protein implicated in regulation of membrane protease activity